MYAGGYKETLLPLFMFCVIERVESLRKHVPGKGKTLMSTYEKVDKNS